MANIPEPTPAQDRRHGRPGRGRTRRRRRIKEWIFHKIGLGAMLGVLVVLAGMLIVICHDGIVGLLVTKFALAVDFDVQITGRSDAPDASPDAKPGTAWAGASPPAIHWRRLLVRALQNRFPDAGTGRRSQRALLKLVAPGEADRLREMAERDPTIWGKTQTVWLRFSQHIDLTHRTGRALPGRGSARKKLIGWYASLRADGVVRIRPDWGFFTRANARYAERAGIAGALAGTGWLLLVTLLFAVPIGVAAAIYLEEMAPRNWITSVIEVNVNNLAAVPSIVFGLLGLAVFLDLFGMRRSTPLVGGMVLAAMTLPVLIIATRAALRSVPFAIREAALALGASQMRCVLDHVLPLALPGIITGAIIGLARAVGETAPLLMIGMVAFVLDTPGSPMEPAAALPVQIYLWSDLPEPLFAYRADAAVLVLVLVLAMVNFVAVMIRRRFEQRW